MLPFASRFAHQLPSRRPIRHCPLLPLVRPTLHLHRLQSLSQRNAFPDIQARRHLWTTHLSTLHPALLAPLVFAGLTLTLWTYKSLMMVLFQSRIIYMPWIPPGCRHETIEDYLSSCHGIAWRKGPPIRTSDGKILATATATIGDPSKAKKRVIVVYFQGNAGSTPMRLPKLSSVLSTLPIEDTSYTFLIPSYRGYWASTGRPNQRGIELDLAAIFSHIRTSYPLESSSLVLWGESIGCGILMQGMSTSDLPVKGIILETPFVSINEMLVAMYPQAWIPYRYLGVFLWNRWELVEALKKLGEKRVGRMLILEAGMDELVPKGQAEKIRDVAEGRGMDAKMVEVKGALHVECLQKPMGKQEVIEFLKGFVRSEG